MNPSKKACISAILLILIAISAAGLTGCGSNNPNAKPTVDLQLAAQQTVAAIYTATAAAKPTDAPPTATMERTQAAIAETPGQPPSEQPGAPVVETPSGVRQEPTRNVVIEQPRGSVTMEPASGSVTQEPFHEPTHEVPSK